MNSSFELDQDHREFRAVCRAFVDKRILPLVEEAERRREFPASLWPEMAQAGMLGLDHPEEHGGSGGGTLAIAILSEELGRSSGGIAVTPLVSSYMAAPHLTHFGTPEQQQHYLAPLLAGRAVAAIAITEPGAGSDVAGISTLAKPADGGYSLSGTKMFITNRGIADTLIVAARTDPADRHHGITMFIVERDAPGFTVGRPLQKMGWHASDTRELIFQDCFVPDSRVLGAIGGGFGQIMHAFQTERITLAGMGVGLAAAALDDALAYAKERSAFGSPIGSFQRIRHSLAQMATDVHAARLLTYQAAAKIDSGGDFAGDVAMAKLISARVANEVADRAVQIFGGYGYIEETRVAMHYRDARILPIGGGTDEVQLEILAKRMGLGA